MNEALAAKAIRDAKSMLAQLLTVDGIDESIYDFNTGKIIGRIMDDISEALNSK